MAILTGQAQSVQHRMPGSTRAWHLIGRIRPAVLPSLIVAGLLAGASHGWATSEYQVKAAFMYNFAKFVEWPASALPNTGDPVVVGVLGKDPFGGNLERMLGGRSVAGRPFVIERVAGLEDLGRCNILFIDSSQYPQLDRILAALDGRAVLTVGEGAGFAERGGMINFTIRDGKIHLEINPARAKQAGLKISSKLLRLATVVGGARYGGLN